MKDHDPDPDAVDHVEFQERNVPSESDHDYGFWGTYTYRDETNRVHTIERMFEVYTDPDRRENGNPVVVLEETHLVADEPEEETRAGDATKVDQTTTELVVDVGSETDTVSEEAAVSEWCREWHESHLERPAA